MFITALLLAVQAVTSPAGHWEGKIEIPGHEMGITLDLDKRKDGVWIGSVSITMSTSIDVPLAGITIEGASVKFTATLPGKTSFEGKLSTDGNALSGLASSIDGSAPFTLARKGEPAVNVPPPSSALPAQFAGTWAGRLDVNGRTVRVVAKLTAAADGTATGTLVSSNDSAIQEIPLSTVTVKDNALTLESRAVSGIYRGTLGERNVSVPLTLRRQ